MNCPHCQKELPEKHGSGWCPVCGKDLPRELRNQPENLPLSLPPFKINWLIFFLILLAPAIATTLTAATITRRHQQVSPSIAIFGGGAAGIVCGIMLGRFLGRTITSRILLSFILSAIMMVVGFILCFIGCSVGGYKFVFN